MIELALLILALICLFSSVEVSAFFLILAIGVQAWKRRIHADELDQLRKAQSEQNDSLFRQIKAQEVLTNQLLKEVAALSKGVTPAPSAKTEGSPVTPTSPEPEKVSSRVDAFVPATPMAPEASRLSVTPKSAPSPTEPTPQQPAPPKSTAPPPPVPPKATPSEGSIPSLPRPVVPPAPPVPPPSMASHKAPSPVAPMRVAAEAPQRSLRDRVKSALALEEVLGTNWLNKLGIIILVLGVALFGIYELGELGAAGKVALLFTVALAMLGGGIYLERRERYQIIGRTGIGGGWALLFFTTYAMHHVIAMKVIGSETLDMVLMLIVAIAMALHTLRYRSQVVTGLAFLLAYSTIALSHDTVYALAAGAVLAIGVVIITVRMNWYELEVFGILSSYLNHLYWLWKLLGPAGADHRMFPEFYASAAILIVYWLSYRISYVIRRVKSAAEENTSTVAALLNTIALLAVMKFQSARPEMAFFALLILGALELALGQLPITKKRRPAFVLLTVLGIALMVAAVPFRYSGENVSILWLLGAELLLAAGIILKEVVFRRMGLLTGLLVGVHVLAIDSVQLFKLRATSEAPLAAIGILLFTCAVLYYANSQFITRRWRQLVTNDIDDKLFLVHSYLGAITTSLACWAIAPSDWTALSLAIFLVLLAFAYRRLQSADLFTQASIIGAVVLTRTVLVNLRLFEAPPSHISLRYLLVPVIAACFYIAAAVIVREKDDAVELVRHLFSWSATGLLALLIWTEVPAAWIPIAWLALGSSLALIGRRWNLPQLCYQENVLAAATVVQLIAHNYISTALHGPFTLRLITVGIAAAGLYAISRVTTPRSVGNRWVPYLHTWAATGLLAALAWYEAPNAWLAVIWIGFALALAIVGRLFAVEELPWQTHILSLLAVARAVTDNIYVTDLYHGVSLRLISLTIVAGILYLLTRVVPMAEEWRKKQFHHAYSSVASVLVGLLMWYELQPISVAVAWGLFGVVLFEIGLMRKVLPLRVQGYLALCAAFVRIYFVNLAAETAPGDVLGPRVTTVAPLAIMFFFVYWQAAASDNPSDRESRFHVDTLLAYIGSITVAALLYFQVPGGWIATYWSVMVVALLAAALLLRREVFLHQALLLAIATLSRGVIHNLFGSGYFTDAGWKGRYFEIGSAVLVLAAGLPLAFMLRRKFPVIKDRSRFTRFVTTFASRPEQVMFFVPVILLTLMLALKMRAGMVTVAWGIEALIVVVLALFVSERSYRLTGVALLLLCVGKILVVDAWRLAPRDRYITFIVLGLALLAVSFLYSKYRETIRQYL